MYKISVLAMFKNEMSIIEEWILHYINEGVEHFYLIDNGSTDDYISIINKYKNKISLIIDSTHLPNKTQSTLYNKHYLEQIKKETEWIIICDIDEYFYINDNIKLINYFTDNKNNNLNYDILWVPWRLFGTKFENTPESLVKSLVFRKKDEIKNSFGYGKSIVKTNKILKLNIHLCDMIDNYKLLKIKFDDSLRLNHYKLISEYYYKNNKCSRGGGESGMVSIYTMKSFHEQNKNFLEVKDNILANK